MLARRQMHSDLMGATRFQTDIKVRVRPKSLRDPVVRHSRLAIGDHRHLGAGSRVAPNRLIDRAAAGKSTATDRAVETTDRSICQLRHQRLMRQR